MLHRISFARHHTAAFCLGALSLVPASLGAQAEAKRSPGFEFDMHSAMSVTGAVSAMLGGNAPSYSGHGVVVGERMRIDVLDGALPQLVEKGDYILFDTAGVTIVHPAKKEFVSVPKDLSSKMLDQLVAMGITVGVGGVAIALDSLPGTDTIAGLPTRHYRMSVRYTVILAGMATQQMRSEAVTEYWMGSIAGLAANPLQRTAQLSATGQGLNSTSASRAFKELASRTDSVERRLPGIALRIRATTTSETSIAGAMSVEVTSEITRLKNGPVADGLFVVPSDYTRGVTPLPGGN